MSLTASIFMGLFLAIGANGLLAALAL
jgi:hypothetical protein